MECPSPLDVTGQYVLPAFSAWPLRVTHQTGDRRRSRLNTFPEHPVMHPCLRVSLSGISGWDAQS